MYESFFGMEHTPFVRDVPPEKLFESNAFRETLGRLAYVADRQMFAVVTADSGCGKSTLIRRFYSELPKEDYIILYLSDSKLTPRWFYKGLLDQLGLESRFYRGDSKRQLQQEIEVIRKTNNRNRWRLLGNQCKSGSGKERCCMGIHQILHRKRLSCFLL